MAHEEIRTLASCYFTVPSRMVEALLADYDRLAGEVERLSKMLEEHKDNWLAWEGKRRDLELDAERYRMIRNIRGPFEVTKGGVLFWNKGLDTMVDAALSADSGAGKEA